VRRTVVVATAALSVAGVMPLSGSSAGAAGDAGSLSAVFGQNAKPGCFTAQYNPPDGYRCPPAAMAAAVLSNGKVLFWDGLEGMNKVQLNVVAEFGDVAQNDQSRVLDLSGKTPTFATPGNQSADGNGSLAEPIDSPLPGAVDSSGNDYDLFCSPLVQLADGTVLAAGGTKYYLEPGVTDPTTGKSYGVSELQGLKATRIFDPKQNTWENLPGSSDMHYGRWYPTLVTLPTGNVFVASGVTKLIKPVYDDGRQMTDSGRNVVETETFDLASKTWTVNHGGPSSDPTLSDSSQQSLPLFARLHLLPDGKVYYDAAGQTFNPDGQGYDEATWVHAKVYNPATQAWSDLAADNPFGVPLVDGLPLGFRGSGFDVLLPLVPDSNGNYTQASVFNGGGVVGPTPGTYIGDNSTTINTITTTNGADTLTSKSGPTLLNRRWYGSAVVLPDGEVFVTNGADRDEVDAPGSGTPVYQTELIDPNAGSVTAGPSLDSNHGRTYHNTAILLPDGRVLIGGHAPIATGYAFQNDTAHTALGFSAAESDSTFQIYSPPYLSYGSRPVIDQVPSRTANNKSLTIETSQAKQVTKVVLVRDPSMTHLTDGDQRNVQLVISKKDDDSVTVRIPNSNVAPPGPYMLFIETTKQVNGAAKLVPSVSKPVTISNPAPTTTQSASMTLTAIPPGPAQAQHSAHAASRQRPSAMAAAAPAATLRATPAAAVSAPSRSRHSWPYAAAALAAAFVWMARRRLAGRRR